LPRQAKGGVVAAQARVCLGADADRALLLLILVALPSTLSSERLAAAQIATDLLTQCPSTRVDLRCHEKETRHRAAPRELKARLMSGQLLEPKERTAQEQDCRSQEVVRRAVGFATTTTLLGKD
jgi:hypothetical protein